MRFIYVLIAAMPLQALAADAQFLSVLDEARQRGISEKKDYETTAEYQARLQADCSDAAKSKLCGPVEFSMALVGYYNADTERYSVSPPVAGTYVSFGECAMLEETSKTELPSYTAVNGYGARTEVRSTSYEALGVIYKRPKAGLFGGISDCVDSTKFLDGFKISREDYKASGGYVVKLTGVPAAPYFEKKKSYFKPTFKYPSESRWVMDLLWVKPVKIQVVSKNTGAVIYESAF